MLLGINYPWLDYGWDFGPPPAVWTQPLDPAAFREARRLRIRRDLHQIAREGFAVVRWFILGDGLSLTAANPLPALYEDFEALLRVCLDAHVQLLPSLLDFHFCLPATCPAPGLLKGGRAALLRNPNRRRQLLDEILDPLLAISRAHPGAIYSWEAMNEPEWVTQPRFGALFPGRRTVPRAAMHGFLSEAVARINAAGFGSTIGWADWRTIRAWNTLDWNISLQQVHYYAAKGDPLPRAADLCPGPCLIGEFAAAPNPAWPGGEHTLEQRLNTIQGAGYSGALLWSLNASDAFSRAGSPAHRRP